MIQVSLSYESFFTGSPDVNDEFSKLSAHEAKQKLSDLLVKMDTNGDMYITKNEISDWVLNNFRYTINFMVD